MLEGMTQYVLTLAPAPNWRDACQVGNLICPGNIFMFHKPREVAGLTRLRCTYKYPQREYPCVGVSSPGSGAQCGNDWWCSQNLGSGTGHEGSP